MSGPAKAFVLLPDEIRHILVILTVSSAAALIYGALSPDLPAGYEPACVIVMAGFALVFSLIRYVFSLVVPERVSVFAVSAAALLIAFLLRDNAVMDMMEYSGPVVTKGALSLIVYLLWLVLRLYQGSLVTCPALCLVSFGIHIYSYFTGMSDEPQGALGKVIYASLFVLFIHYITAFTGYEKKRMYPFTFFVFMLVCILMIPGRKDPINWEPVIDAGRKIAAGAGDMADSFAYYLSGLVSGAGYQTGYTSFEQSDGPISRSKRTELVVKTTDNTTFYFVDEESGRRFKGRRTVYLTGTGEVDHKRILDVLYSFYAHGLVREDVYLFARTSKLDIGYAYLKTADEIVPQCPIRVTGKTGDPVVGPGNGRKHKKGYELHTDYLDLDLGSPYLIRILRSPNVKVSREEVDYDTLAKYAYMLFGIRFSDTVSQDEYASWQHDERFIEEDLDINGASERMDRLAHEITAGCDNDFDKCLAIETYLRQYRYNTEAGGNGKGNTGSAEGMSTLADGFLFEQGEGYCIHFASSMVMLMRLNGIPARLDTGYRYSFPFDPQDSYEVRAENAHAWPEAYISGFGWVGFEPTSIMTSSGERSWHRRPAAGEGADNGSRHYVSGGNEPVHAPSVVPEAEDVSGKRDEELKTVLGSLKLIAVIVSMVVLMIFLMLGGSWLYRSVRYRNAGPEGRLKLDIDDILRCIRNYSGCTFEDRGLLTDYSPYVPDRFSDRTAEAFEICYGMMYGKGTVTEEEVSAVRELRDTMRKEMRPLHKKSHERNGDQA